jgi:hypothetical protein
MSIVEFFEKFKINPVYIAENSGLSIQMIRHYKSGTKKPGPKAKQKINLAIAKLSRELRNTYIY